ncbi:MAG: ATP-binding protein [Anaerolineae bacterium]|jgi:hypothetical protein
MTGGIIPRSAPTQPIGCYFVVPSIDKALVRIQELGGKVFVPKTAVPGMGYCACCIDPENNYFGTLERRFQTYLRPDLLVLDYIGLKPLHPPAPEHLYDVINERCERGIIMLTSNRAPEEWPDLFGSPLLASAGLDRLTHRAQMIVITGSSFRAHGAQDPVKEVPSESTP